MGQNFPSFDYMVHKHSQQRETVLTSFPLQAKIHGKTQFDCTLKYLMSDIKSVSCSVICAHLPHVPPLMAVRLCLSACSSWISSDSSVAAASFSLTASVSIHTAPPCWTGGGTKTKAYCPSWVKQSKTELDSQRKCLICYMA